MTQSTRSRDIIRTWHLFDAKGKVLGRIAVQIAHALMGKDKHNFVSHLDCGNHVVVVNAAHVVATGKKETEKLYTHYSGFPGGFKAKALSGTPRKTGERRETRCLRHVAEKQTS